MKMVEWTRKKARDRPRRDIDPALRPRDKNGRTPRETIPLEALLLSNTGESCDVAGEMRDREPESFATKGDRSARSREKMVHLAESVRL